MSICYRTIELSGILDCVQADNLNQMADEYLAEGANVLLIDLKELHFLDSSGLGALVTVLKKIRAIEGKLYLCSLTDQVEMILSMTNMGQFFLFCKDPSEFEEVILKELTQNEASADMAR